MDKYYHFTSYGNLNSIGKEGLVPQIGSRTRSIGDNRCAVFLSKGIINSILMYGSLLNHYNNYAGNRGEKAIHRYSERIKYYLTREKEVGLDSEDILELKALQNAIIWIQQIIEYKNFSEYIGDGVYLTVLDIRNVNSNDPKDCYTQETVPPEKISVLELVNLDTGQETDSREAVLSYFMSITPVERITEALHNVVAIHDVVDLYHSRADMISYYSANNFELVETPIDLYLKKKENKCL